MFDILIVFLKEFLKNVNFEKKNQQTTKMRGKFQGGKELNLKSQLHCINLNGRFHLIQSGLKTIEL